MTDEALQDEPGTEDGASSTDGSPASRRWWHRIGPLLAAGLVGLVLGTGGTAWQLEGSPFGASRLCWDSLPEENPESILLDGDEGGKLRVHELPPAPETTYGGFTRASFTGQCRITSYDDGDADRALIVRLHTLSPANYPPGYGLAWQDEFLSSWMTSLGGGLTGMTSHDRAWVALPESCVGEHGKIGSHTVVDVSYGAAGVPHVRDDGIQARRELFARMAVQAANGAMEQLGCRSRLPTPPPLPAMPELHKTRPAALCGVDGLETPVGMRKSGAYVRRSNGQDSPARICEVAPRKEDMYYDDLKLRLITVEDPVLGNMDTLQPFSVRGTGTDDFVGVVSTGRAIGELDCPTGNLSVMMEHLNGAPSVQLQDTVTRTLLKPYMKAEAQRLNCTLAR